MKKSEFKRGLDTKEALDIGMDSISAKEIKQKKLSDAVGTLIESIVEDPDLMYGYLSNIAMCQIDAEYNYRRKTGKKYLNRKDKHLIANKGAFMFLEIWAGCNLPESPFITEIENDIRENISEKVSCK